MWKCVVISYPYLFKEMGKKQKHNGHPHDKVYSPSANKIRQRDDYRKYWYRWDRKGES